MEVSALPVYALGLFLSSQTHSQVFHTSHTTRSIRTVAHLFGRPLGTHYLDCAVREIMAALPGRGQADEHGRCRTRGDGAGGDPWWCASIDVADIRRHIEVVQAGNRAIPWATTFIGMGQRQKPLRKNRIQWSPQQLIRMWKRSASAVSSVILVWQERKPINDKQDGKWFSLTMSYFSRQYSRQSWR
ncbi:hypothetical protein EDB86DRAFT_696131 [Lactarius hatsudake]|nr:hypothetical protein EDB86DRAFT_696131 [Lactarius hatsudake]